MDILTLIKTEFKEKRKQDFTSAMLARWTHMANLTRKLTMGHFRLAIVSMLGIIQEVARQQMGQHWSKGPLTVPTPPGGGEGQK